MPDAVIDEKVLLRVAKNARLNLSKEEKKRFLAELKDILKAFSRISEVDVSGEKPSFQPVPVKNVFRQDKQGKCLSQEQALSSTKHKRNGYFLGPRVV